MKGCAFPWTTARAGAAWKVTASSTRKPVSNSANTRRYTATEAIDLPLSAKDLLRSAPARRVLSFYCAGGYTVEVIRDKGSHRGPARGGRHVQLIWGLSRGPRLVHVPFRRSDT